MIITFDLFSALTDTRSGASVTFAEIAGERGWPLAGADVYDAWDARNKALQREARAPVTFRDVSGEALALAYADLGLDVADPIGEDLARLHASIPDWPLWPDVADAIARVAQHARVGLLSNVDDDLARLTRAHALVDPRLVLSSQRLGAFKPAPEIYRAAAAAVAPQRLVHVAASARDVRGALEAGITTIRLARPGHAVDPEGPQPPLEAQDAADLAGLLATLD
ncbi:(S)-2-haloacid dehalogenase 4A [Nocardioides dokdonensis FR1436]|uniref:(S)-2-haloacid dehalogenase 4A n=1 Tax=Nocardioides dokdonensis FR1436 TaxID=1300347 RepID=A0A1A9GJJ7_9ACTN|nr:HAD-IA family hydrolase [Nocardioides dokdonensis]ANH37850.1 (S)-2-haloacid dehalogenase 4A [Nocardioides dokdonensis FR1436]